jgi:hypothetical protein
MAAPPRCLLPPAEQLKIDCSGLPVETPAFAPA